jgi:type VI secretion system secreted protein Hcp
MAANLFLEIEGEKSGPFKGSSTDADHKDNIVVVAWYHAFKQPATGANKSAFGGLATSMAEHSGLTFTKYFDNASDDVLKACWTGEQLKKCIFHMYRAAGGGNTKASTEYLKIELEKAIISNYQVKGGKQMIDGQLQEDMPVEEITLNYKKVTYTFVPTDADGNPGEQMPISHDLGQNVVA